MDLSVVIPTLNAAATLPATLAAIGQGAEIVVVDGGSSDGTIDAVCRARVLTAPRGRGRQLAAGIEAATHDWLLLMHADTRLSPGWQAVAAGHMAAATAGPGSTGSSPGSETRGGSDGSDRDRASGQGPPAARTAGYFRFRLDSDDPRARRFERLVAWRCRVFALPYGDQGLLIHRDLLAHVGGMRPLPLMEDVDLIRRLGRRHLVPLAADAVTSAAKWERDGWTRRSLRNVACLSLWFLGVPPSVIRRLYG